jgi:uncharacterized protein (TIGR02594 family)
VNVTAHFLGTRFLGVREIAGAPSEPVIEAMLRGTAAWARGDETAWCSAFQHTICFLLDLPRVKSLRARDWLDVGRPIQLDDARRGFDIVILGRGRRPFPGPEVRGAPGHVGLFDRLELRRVWILGGNQGNAVSVAPFDPQDILGIRRLYEEAA